MAPIYDYVMRHVNYRKWADYLRTLVQLSGVKVETILDLACGTGSLDLYLSEMGYRVFGFDYSPGMVLQGMKKAGRAGKKFPLWCGDMTRFTQQQPVDAVLCLYDSINYLMKNKQWLSTFHNAAEALKPGGLFIFDVSTEANSLKHFQEKTEKDRGPSFKYTRHSTYDKKAKVQINEFQITWKNKPNQVFVETHRQIVKSLESVEKLIPKSEFSVLGIYDNYTTEQATEFSDRVHFLLQKNG